MDAPHSPCPWFELVFLQRPLPWRCNNWALQNKACVCVCGINSRKALGKGTLHGQVVGRVPPSQPKETINQIRLVVHIFPLVYVTRNK